MQTCRCSRESGNPGSFWNRSHGISERTGQGLFISEPPRSCRGGRKAKPDANAILAHTSRWHIPAFAAMTEGLHALAWSDRPLRFLGCSVPFLQQPKLLVGFGSLLLVAET